MTIALLAFLLLALFLLIYLTLRIRGGKSQQLRSLPGLEGLPALVERAAEAGKPIHVSVGIAGVGGVATSETWTGLTILGQVADEAAACDVPLIITVADPTVLALAQDLLQRAYARHGHTEGYDPTQVRFVAPEPTAYAMGVMGLLSREPLAGSVMIGSFGDEFLLMGETGRRRGVYQLVGSSAPQTLPFVYATADEALVGEEMFAGGAYTSRLPSQVASLLTEDWLRWVLVAGIILTAIWKLLA
jgi:hypothetical protein